MIDAYLTTSTMSAKTKTKKLVQASCIILISRPLIESTSVFAMLLSNIELKIENITKYESFSITNLNKFATLSQDLKYQHAASSWLWSNIFYNKFQLHLRSLLRFECAKKSIFIGTKFANNFEMFGRLAGEERLEDDQ